MNHAAQIDLYQLTSLVTHHARGRTHDPVVMTFLSRNLPKRPSDGAPARGFLLWVGLQRCLDHLEHARFDEPTLDALRQHPMLGPALAEHPDLVGLLRDWRFRGRVRAPLEGTPLWAGKAVRRDGSPVDVAGCAPSAYTPYLVVETDLLSAKLIETPLLSIINHLAMVATKAAHVVSAAGGRPVIEFGTRRTHPEAAIDAALAAWIGGCSATSNVAAHVRYGVPVSGTMDHFAVQAWEEPGVPRWQTEEAFFRAFHQQYPGKDTLLVDTYDTFGERAGLAAAVRATGGQGPAAVRIDSGISRDNLWRARRRLDALGATRTTIVASGGIDEAKIAELGDAPVDAFGVGENLVVSADAPVGVGAVGKLSMVRGVPTTKLSRGSGKAHLPGVIQVWRTEDGDLVGLNGESHPGEPLLREVWSLDGGRAPAPPWSAVRERALTSLVALPPERKRPRSVALPISDALFELFAGLAAGGGE